MRMRSGARALLGVVLVAVFNSCSTSNNVTSNSTTSFMWVATQGDQKVNSFNINLSTGAVSHIGSAVATGVTPTAVAIAPDGKALFITNSGDSTIGVYTFNSDGSLNAPSTAPASTPALSTPRGMATDGTNSLLFVANQGADFISVYTISPGALAFKTAFPIQASPPLGGDGPVALALAPTSFTCADNSTAPPTTRNCFALYAANQVSNTITGYDYFLDSSMNLVFGMVDASGNFMPNGTVAGSPYLVGNNPSGLAFSRCAGITTSTATTTCPTADNNNLFVANSGSNNVTVFTACIQVTGACPVPNGTLTQVAGSPFAAGTGPVAFMVDPAGDFVYVLNRGSAQVSEYSYSPATGGLTSLSPPTASTGVSPFSGGITANSTNTTSTSNWIFVTNNGASSLSAFGVANQTQSDGTVKPTGKLNPLGSGPITVTGQPSAILVR